jgi:hypothetical protein
MQVPAQATCLTEDDSRATGRARSRCCSPWNAARFSQTMRACTGTATSSFLTLPPPRLPTARGADTLRQATRLVHRLAPIDCRDHCHRGRSGRGSNADSRGGELPRRLAGRGASTARRGIGDQGRWRRGLAGRRWCRSLGYREGGSAASSCPRFKVCTSTKRGREWSGERARGHESVPDRLRCCEQMLFRLR